MPRLAAAVPKYRKHKNSGQAVVTLYGRDNYLGPFGSKPSKELYRHLIAEYLAANRQAAVEVDEITIIELIADYWRHCIGYYVTNGQPTTEQNSIRIAIRDLNYLPHTGSKHLPHAHRCNACETGDAASRLRIDRPIVESASQVIDTGGLGSYLLSVSPTAS